MVLWDLARGVELTFLPIGRTTHVRFEATGNMLTLSAGRSASSAGRFSLTRFAANSASVRRAGCRCR